MNNKAKYIIVLGGVIILLIVGYKIMPRNEIIIQTNNTKIEEEKIYVHVEGCVHNPGLIEVKYNMRLYEVLELAGGVTQDADISKVNLASIIVDAQKIYIPSLVKKISTNEEKELISTSNSEEIVNINTADEDELQKLIGIGPSTAEKIIEYRENEGYFTNLEELMNIEGIGQAKYDKIKDNIGI